MAILGQVGIGSISLVFPFPSALWFPLPVHRSAASAVLISVRSTFLISLIVPILFPSIWFPSVWFLSIIQLAACPIRVIIEEAISRYAINAEVSEFAFRTVFALRKVVVEADPIGIGLSAICSLIIVE